ncbi:MAG TPA: DUF427 domain-containing protein [Hyphomicrobium sp.]|nr:DUF427 domain-containing protein [Hyphomicrobium sp.]
MTERVKLSPGPTHPITCVRNPRRVVVTFDGAPIADTRNAITLNEASYPAVQYIPREDVDMRTLQRSTHTTYCPYKGDASYFHLSSPEAISENAVWSYEAPYDTVAAIKDRLAFYPDRVEISERDD